MIDFNSPEWSLEKRWKRMAVRGVGILALFSTFLDGKSWPILGLAVPAGAIGFFLASSKNVLRNIAAGLVIFGVGLEANDLGSMATAHMIARYAFVLQYYMLAYSVSYVLWLVIARAHRRGRNAFSV